MTMDLTAYRVEQTIKVRATVSAGQTGYARVAIPAGTKAALKGYGYTWYTLNTYRLSTGQISFPNRTDQEGSASIPRIFSVPFECRSGGNVELEIRNADSSDHTYDVVFYLLADTMIAVESTGGELLVGTTSAGSSPTSSVPTTVLDGTKTTTNDTAVALAASVSAYDKITVQADPDNTVNMLIGNGTSQSIKLGPGQSIDIAIDDPSKIYIKRTSSTNVTANWMGS
jgi:hypothetical protein